MPKSHATHNTQKYKYKIEELLGVKKDCFKLPEELERIPDSHLFLKYVDDRTLLPDPTTRRVYNLFDLLYLKPVDFLIVCLCAIDELNTFLNL